MGIMAKLRQLFPKTIIIFIIAAVVACFGLPLLTSVLGVSKVHRIIYLFLILDPLLTAGIAAIIKRQSLAPWWLLLFPAVFALSIWWRFAKYNYWLAGIFLLLSIIIYLVVPARQASTTRRQAF